MSNVDQKIENAANKIERAANKAWKKRSFRIGLMIGAAHLSEKGYKSAATCLFGLGAVGLVCDLLFNRK